VVTFNAETGTDGMLTLGRGTGLSVGVGAVDPGVVSVVADPVVVADPDVVDDEDLLEELPQAPSTKVANAATDRALRISPRYRSTTRFDGHGRL
jgi:hypothetical protein